MKVFSLGRKISTLIPLIFLLGSGLLLFFLLLSGASSSSSLLAKFYWLKAETSGLGSYSETKWTNYRLCSASGSTKCGSATAGLPISPADNFGYGRSGLARDFVTNRKAYYYESRIGWAFLLVATFFVILSILMSLPALCLSSTVVVTLITLCTILAFVFIAVSAALYTHILVKAKRTFKNNGQSASIGKKMMAFIWTTVFMLAVTAFLMFLLGCCQFASNRYEHHKEREAGGAYYSDEDTYNDGYAYDNTNTKQKKTSFWKRNKGTNTVDDNDQYNGTTTNNRGAVGAGAAGAGVAGAGGAAAYEANKGSTKSGNTASTAGANEPSKINFFRVRNNRNNSSNVASTTNGETGVLGGSGGGGGGNTLTDDEVYGRQRTGNIDV